MEIERKDNVFKVSIPAITDDEIRTIDNHFDEIAHKFSEMIFHDKDLIVAQRVIQNQRAELDKKDKIINEIAEYISKLDIDDEICSKNTINPEYCNEDYTNCKKCIIEYFTKKVETNNTKI